MRAGIAIYAAGSRRATMLSLRDFPEIVMGEAVMGGGISPPPAPTTPTPPTPPSPPSPREPDGFRR